MARGREGGRHDRREGDITGGRETWQKGSRHGSEGDMEEREGRRHEREGMDVDIKGRE